MANKPMNGSRKKIEGNLCVYYDGYWIRYYPPPEETWAARKTLIVHLTRRAFHHTEAGINTPGEKLDEARKAYDEERDTSRKRVNGAMLAGALFNRAADIFTTIVGLAEKGVEISPSNELMQQCSDCLQEAMGLGKTVGHYSGDEGIDELWGEPLKAFTMSIESFYESRYVKIAQTMRDIDKISQKLESALQGQATFKGLIPKFRAFSTKAKAESETMRSDPAIFHVWPQFVAAGEALLEFKPRVDPNLPEAARRKIREGMQLIHDARDLLTYLAGARVPMPKSTQEFLDKCEAYRRVTGHD
jgi:hypothetical protein